MLDDAFDASHFRDMGHALVDMLAGHLDACNRREPMAVLPATDPAASLDAWANDFAGGEDPLNLWREVVEKSNHLHHPRYVGHQVTSPLPVASLTHLLTSFLNNSSAVFEMSPVATAMERHVVKWMGQKLGFPATCDGTLCSGGSLGNLTAMLAAREIVGRKLGMTDVSRASFLVSEQAHYSMARAARVLGLGDAGVIPVPVDAQFRMRAGALEEHLAYARARGRVVVGIVASACTTATGSMDPLEPIADFAKKHNLWMHVDGAHAASVVLSPKYAHLAAGIDRADSVVWDAHKMLLMPALVTGVVFRDGARSYEVFSQKAAYLFEKTAENEWHNLAKRTLECTKASLSAPLYIALRTHGETLFADYTTRMFDLARTFAAMINDAPDFELATKPDCNIVCFRYRPENVNQINLNELQQRIRTRILASGQFYLVQTELPQGLYLRTTLINPRTAERDLQELLDAARGVGE